MKTCALIATDHKTGTAWMKSTFSAICGELGLPFRPIDQKELSSAANIQAPILLFERHSDLSGCEWFIGRPDARILHLIRDPRDVIISGMHYHRVATEAQLHTRRSSFGGKTYQQKLNSLDTDRERYLFEMQNISKNVIARMRKWDYALPNAFECKYEDLVTDESMVLFTAILEHLGFAGDELDTCRKEFWRKSLFGKKARRAGSTHIRSGAARQWPDVFDQGLAEAFLNQFGDVLVRLGYEHDDNWVSHLPKVRRALHSDTAPAAGG